jgi:hypothetical protein
MPSTAVMFDRNALPRPSPFAAPLHACAAPLSAARRYRFSRYAPSRGATCRSASAQHAGLAVATAGVKEPRRSSALDEAGDVDDLEEGGHGALRLVEVDEPPEALVRHVDARLHSGGACVCCTQAQRASRRFELAQLHASSRMMGNCDTACELTDDDSTMN